MANQYVQVAPDSTGKKVDTGELTVGANTVERQRIVIASDTVDVGLAAVSASTPAGGSYGMHTRPIPDGQKVMGSSIPVVIASDQSVIPEGGDVAHDGTDSGNPVKIGGKSLTNTSIPAVVSATGDRVNAWLDMNGRLMVAPGIRSTYTANYRLTTRPYALSWASGGAALKQHATIYHSGSATKTVRIKRVKVWLKNVSAAATIMAEFRRLSSATAPATGNPAITPTPHNPGTAAAEAVCLALPTTAGSEANANAGWGNQEQAIGITGAATALNPIPTLGAQAIILWDSTLGGTDMEELIMRAGQAEGYAIILDASASATVLSTMEIIFTEE
jgi:hypothetical protein